MSAATSELIRYVAKPVQETIEVRSARTVGGSQIHELEVLDRRCWPQEPGGGLDHYGVTTKDCASVELGDLVWLDIDTDYYDGGVDWVLARCTSPGKFVDLATGDAVPSEKNPSVHGRVVRHSWWMSPDAAPEVGLARVHDDVNFVHSPRKVVLTDGSGEVAQVGCWATAALYDSMSPQCPKSKWVVFQSGSGSPGDVVLAHVETIRRKPSWESTNMMVIGRSGQDEQGRATLRSDQPGFCFTNGVLADGVETAIAVWGVLMPSEVDCEALDAAEVLP